MSAEPRDERRVAGRRGGGQPHHRFPAAGNQHIIAGRHAIDPLTEALAKHVRVDRNRRVTRGDRERIILLGKMELGGLEPPAS